MADITLKGKPFHTNSVLPECGDQAPDFVLVDQDLGNRSLQDFSGKKKLLYIVPSLDTPVCSESTKKYNDHAKENPNHTILIISSDLPFAQKRFCGQERVENVITLSTMRSRDFPTAYGVLITDGPLEGICARAQIVLDENNKVLYRELVSEVSDEPDYDSALKAFG